MKVAIHQPNYLPYMGFFQKMALADIFIILDTVAFSKDSFTQRTKIRTKEDCIWLTIPIEKNYYFKSIKDIHLPQDEKWRKKHMMSIRSNYSKSKYFDDKFVDEYYFKKFDKLQEFNEYGIFYLKNKLGIKTEIVRSNELNIDAHLRSSDLLIEIIKKVGGDVYISGLGGKNYMDDNKFFINKIKLEYFEFKPLEYPQRWNGFEPYMSAIDFVFNLGSHLEMKGNNQKTN